MIVKAFFGKHIDLTKIVAISDAYFIDHMGYGGFFVGFHIDAQLLDKPLEYSRKFAHDEHDPEEFRKPRKLPNGDILAVERLQAEINELVIQWKEAVK